MVDSIRWPRTAPGSTSRGRSHRRISGSWRSSRDGSVTPADDTNGMAVDHRNRAAKEPPPGYRVQAEDTTYEVECLLIDAWRAMPSWEKARRLVESCRAVDQLVRAGVRLRHPDANDREVHLRVAALRLGPALMREVYGWDPEREDR